MLFVLLALLGQGSALTDLEISVFRAGNPDFVEQNTGLTSQVFAVDNGDGSVTVTTNGIPAHNTDVFPAGGLTIEEVWGSFTFFKEPVMRAEGQELTCLPSGAIGVAVSGAYIYSWWAMQEGCPYAGDVVQPDICSGIPDGEGMYHYHQYSPCVQMPYCGQESPLYGVALDGIPIYGPIADNGQQLTRNDLDQCGGRRDVNGRYKYHVTADPPYFPSCFKGELRKDLGVPASSFTCSCPHDDTVLREAGGSSEQICDFEGDADLPAVCNDNINPNPLMDRKWIQLQTYQDLAPCCPPGADCGGSCTTEDGVKDVCEVETRRVGVWNNVPKVKSCWEACYDECYLAELCNCKRKCKRECIGRNGASDYRHKREVVRQSRSVEGKRKCKPNHSRSKKMKRN